MQAHIQRHDPDAELFTPEQCHILELSNTADDPAVSIAQARVMPGTRTRWHKVVDTAERYVILQGSGLVEIGDLPAQPVHVGDVVRIPPDCPQRISNTGADELIFLAICTPRFLQQNYIDIESEQAAFDKG